MSTDQEIAGDLGEQWISDVISYVRNSYPSIDSDVFMTLKELLHSKLSDRELTQSNLKEVTTDLIARFVLNTTESEIENED